MEEEIFMISGDLVLMSLMAASIAEILGALYLCYRIIMDMEENIDYSVTRMFLSPRSVNGMKIMMLSLVAFAVINLLIVFFTSAFLMALMIRLNLVMLFGGFMYFFWQISRVTRKRSDPDS